jgi:valyl-tRNA synthetase
VLVTGYDILFFWVARMMMFGLYAMRDKAPDDVSGSVPFRVVALHGMSVTSSASDLPAATQPGASPAS